MLESRKATIPAHGARRLAVVIAAALTIGTGGCSSDPPPIDDAPEPHASDVMVDMGTESSSD